MRSWGCDILSLLGIKGRLIVVEFDPKRTLCCTYIFLFDRLSTGIFWHYLFLIYVCLCVAGMLLLHELAASVSSLGLPISIFFILSIQLEMSVCLLNIWWNLFILGKCLSSKLRKTLSIQILTARSGRESQHFPVTFSLGGAWVKWARVS